MSQFNPRILYQVSDIVLSLISHHDMHNPSLGLKQCFVTFWEKNMEFTRDLIINLSENDTSDILVDSMLDELTNVLVSLDGEENQMLALSLRGDPNKRRVRGVIGVYLSLAKLLSDYADRYKNPISNTFGKIKIKIPTTQPIANTDEHLKQMRTVPVYKYKPRLQGTPYNKISYNEIPYNKIHANKDDHRMRVCRINTNKGDCRTKVSKISTKNGGHRVKADRTEIGRRCSYMRKVAALCRANAAMIALLYGGTIEMSWLHRSISWEKLSESGSSDLESDLNMSSKYLNDGVLIDRTIIGVDLTGLVENLKTRIDDGIVDLTNLIYGLRDGIIDPTVDILILSMQCCNIEVFRYVFPIIKYRLIIHIDEVGKSIRDTSLSQLSTWGHGKYGIIYHIAMIIYWNLAGLNRSVFDQYPPGSFNEMIKIIHCDLKPIPGLVLCALLLHIPIVPAIMYMFPSKLEDESQPINQQMNQQMNQLANKSMNQLVNKSVNQLVNESMNQLANESMNQLANESMNQLVNESMNQLANESMNQLANESMNQLVNESMNQLANESMNQLANKSMNQLANKSMNQLANKSMNQLANESMNQLANESLNQFANEYMGQSANESMNRLVDESIDRLINSSMNQSADKLTDKLIKRSIDGPIDSVLNGKIQENIIIDGYTIHVDDKIRNDKPSGLWVDCAILAITKNYQMQVDSNQTMRNEGYLNLDYLIKLGLKPTKDIYTILTSSGIHPSGFLFLKNVFDVAPTIRDIMTMIMDGRYRELSYIFQYVCPELSIPDDFISDFLNINPTIEGPRLTAFNIIKYHINSTKMK